LEALIDILAYAEGRAALRHLCTVLEGADYRVHRMKDSAHSYGEWLAGQLSERYMAVRDAIGRDIAELEDPEWWRCQGDVETHHVAFEMAQAARQGLELAPRRVENARERVYGPPDADEEPCLHPRLSLEVYTGVTGNADDHGDWMCITCGATFVSRAAAEQDRQRVRAHLEAVMHFGSSALCSGHDD
jgi:hypothetical protein